MRWTVTRTDAATTAGDLLVFPVFQKDDEADLKPLQAATRGLAGGGPALTAAVRRSGFTGKAEALLEELRAQPGVELARADVQWVQRLNAVSRRISAMVLPQADGEMICRSQR